MTMEQNTGIPTGTLKSFKDIEAMAPEEVRKLIIQDALDALNSGLVRAEQGVYITLRFPFATPISDDQQLRDLLPKAKGCNVCAMGIAFLGALRLFDEFSVVRTGCWQGLNSRNLDVPRSSLLEYLGRFFDEQQLNLIEMVFEGRPVQEFQELFFDELRSDIATFHFEHGGKDHPDKLLKNILQNMLDNNGTFVLPKADGSFVAVAQDPYDD
jgi:hypothetical protein